MIVRTALVDRPLNPAQLLSEVSAPEHGAAVLFVGSVRNSNQGRAVDGIDYSAYVEMAELELQRIAADGVAAFGTAAIVVEHRVGALEVGEASVVVATAHPHRATAYDVNRYVIEELKRRLPVWKQEHYLDGSRSWVAANDTPSSGADIGSGAGDGGTR
jgi:molybdopterin synthase catalytic subunit